MYVFWLLFYSEHNESLTCVSMGLNDTNVALEEIRKIGRFFEDGNLKKKEQVRDVALIFSSN